MIQGLSNREDSFLIGFVSSAKWLGAITMEEAYQWIYSLMKNHDDLPPYMYCLLDAKTNKEFDEIIGFEASANITEKEFDALRGISFLRNIRQDEEAISRKKALKALADSPQLEKRFRETFPFIEW